MYIHKRYLREHVTDKKSVNELAFFLLLKTKFPSSIIYSEGKFTEMSERIGVDRRTARKYFIALIEKGLIHKRGKHYRAISIEKEFEYKLKTTGKKDRKWRNKYYRLFLKKRYTFKDYKNIIRGLLVKSFYQSKALSTITKQMREHNSKRVNKICRLSSTLGVKSKSAETESVPMSVFFLGRMMGVSKSTAQRTMDGLVKMKLVYKKVGEWERRGLKRCLRAEIKDNLPYGIFCHNGVVYQKHINKYVI